MTSTERSRDRTTRRPRSSAELRHSLVVELCGLPGAGKTTMAASLAGQLRARGIDARVADQGVSAAAPALVRLLRKSLSTIAALATNPLAEIRAAQVLGAGQANRREMIAVPVLLWVRKRVLARSRRLSGVAIVEEGLVQTLWSAGLCSRDPSPSTLVALVASAERPHVVVHVDVPPSLAVDRLTSRASRHSRIQQLAPADQLPTMQRADALLTRILDEWRTQSLSDVVVVDGLSATDSAAKVADTLVRHLKTRPTGTG